MATLNQERFTLAIDDAIQELRNGAKSINTSKSTSFCWKTRCKEKSISLEIEEHYSTELKSLIEKFYAEMKNTYDFRYFLHAIFFHVYIVNKSFLVEFGINLYL